MKTFKRLESLFYIALCFKLKRYVLICSEEKESSLFMSSSCFLLSALLIFFNHHYIIQDYIYILFCDYSYHTYFISFMYLNEF